MPELAKDVYKRAKEEKESATATWKKKFPVEEKNQRLDEKAKDLLSKKNKAQYDSIRTDLYKSEGGKDYGTPREADSLANVYSEAYDKMQPAEAALRGEKWAKSRMKEKAMKMGSYKRKKDKKEYQREAY